MRKGGIVWAIVFSVAPSASVAFCSPPTPPALTSEALAREFEPEFRRDFEHYFAATSIYFRCLEDERRRIMVEAEETAQRYDRFLSDAEKWVTE